MVSYWLHSPVRQLDGTHQQAKYIMWAFFFSFTMNIVMNIDSSFRFVLHGFFFFF